MEYCLNNITGEKLQDDLIHEVDNNWVANQGKVYEFYQYQNKEKKNKEKENKEKKQGKNKTVIFTIKVTGMPNNPQPGNGKVTFINSSGESIAYSYRNSSLTDKYRRTDFPQLRREYLTNNLDNVVVDENLAANVLLSFEVARRVQSEDHEKFLRRSEVKEAIERMMSLSGNDYSSKVS